MKVTAYCMKCKAKRTMKAPKQKKKGISGTCSKCGTKMFKFGKM